MSLTWSAKGLLLSSRSGVEREVFLLVQAHTQGLLLPVAVGALANRS